jgi:hypothetical protein
MPSIATKITYKTVITNHPVQTQQKPSQKTGCSPIANEMYIKYISN